MHVNTFVIFILSAIIGLAFIIGKFWAYDGCYSSEFSDNMKTLYLIFDGIKDVAFIFVVLVYLLYSV